MRKFEVSVLCVTCVGLEDTRGQMLCQLCDLPRAIHSYPGDQTDVGQSIPLLMCCVFQPDSAGLGAAGS